MGNCDRQIPAARQRVTESNIATFPPVRLGTRRPLWSVLIPTHNCGCYLREALESVLVQDRGAGKMEIIVVDDYSTRDHPEDVIASIGTSRVKLIKQAANVGKARNYETGLLASSGILIHQLHCDDRVKPGFYDAMESAFAEFPDAGAFFCESNYIDGAGNITGHTGRERETVGIIGDFLDRIVVRQRIQTPSIAIRREVFEVLGGFDRRLPAFEDWEMWIRLSQFYPVGFIPEILADYRVSAGNSSTATVLDGTRFNTLRLMLSIVDNYLPPSVLERCHKARNRQMAEYVLHALPLLLEAKQYRAIGRMYLDALSFNRDPSTFRRIVGFTRHFVGLALKANRDGAGH